MPRLMLPAVLRPRAGARLRTLLLLAAGAAGLLSLTGGAGAFTARGFVPLPPLHAAGPEAGDVTQGALRVTRGDQVVECPLRHTDVRAEVSGFIARVRVTQTFVNPYDEAVEAVYVFPLSNTGAVDEMTMVVGERRVTGVVKRRAAAREAYEQAVAQGYTASLLEQERPNIFTQSVGNIPPGQTVKIEIAYVDVLPYEGGRYEFHFPMVVGPRYIPGTPVAAPGDGWAPDTDQVQDASRITPPVLKPGFRNGHDVSLTVMVDAGVPIRALDVPQHEASVQRPSPARAVVTLSPRDGVPNKDFVLSYQVAGERPQTAVLTHSVPGDDGYFLLMLQPRDVEEALRNSPPRDVCFLVDVSGSMSGPPIAKVSEAMERFFERMRPQDRLQLVTFAGAAQPLFSRYRPADASAIAEALTATRAMRGGGGTEMLRGIQAVMAEPVDPERVRIVVMLTDGYIGNEDAIIGEVGRRAGDQMRFWTVGIGSSPNRHLIDGVARQGGGLSAVLGLDQDPTELVGKIMDRVQRAQLARVSVDWGGMDVVETYPARIGELWAGRPVFLLGRYRGAGAATLTLSGLAEGDPVSFAVPVSLEPAGAAAGGHAVLAKAWARKKIEHLDDQMAVAGASEELVEEVTGVALQYHLMSSYTSFVAVDERAPSVDPAAPPRRMLVPVPLPLGVSYQGVFGDEGFEVKGEDAPMQMAAFAAPLEKRRPGFARAARARRHGVEGGVAGGVPGGIVGGVVGGNGDVYRAGGAGAPPATVPAAPLPLRLHAPPSEPVRSVRRKMDGPADARVRAAAKEAGRREAAEDLKAAERLQAAGDLDGAALALTRAATVAQMQARLGGGDDGGLATTLASLEQVLRAREEKAGRALPALQKPLAMILRNTDLGSALAAVAAAAGVPLDVAPGSLDDVGATFGASALRVAVLDLRGVSAARAFTWLTQPAGLQWSLRQGHVVVRSGRRGSGGDWVYGLRTSAPSPLRRRLAAVDARATVAPLGSHFVLVHASAAGHATALQAGAFLGGNDPGPAAQKNQPASLESGPARAAVDAFTWPLLAAALRGEAADDAVSELLEAWQVPGVSALDAPALLRSLWVIRTARAARPADAALARLGEVALEATRRGGQPVPVPVVTGDGAVYVALLQGPDLSPTLPPTDLSGSAPHAALVRLLDPKASPQPADTAVVLDALAAGQLRGDDALLLSGLALHRAGGAAWRRFRENTAELARTAGASGAALRAVNRLEGSRI
jgi:Ca-activated chloride channel homolog